MVDAKPTIYFLSTPEKLVRNYILQQVTVTWDGFYLSVSLKSDCHLTEKFPLPVPTAGPA